MIFTYCLKYGTYYYYTSTKNESITLVMLGVEGVISTISNAKWFVSYETFVARIANKEIPGTFMNLLNGVSNLANDWHKPIIMFFVDKIPYIVLVLLGLIFSIFFHIFLTKKFLISN